MNVWQSFARISGVAFQVFFAVAIGIGAGIGIDHLVPQIGHAGVLVGALLGFGAALYVMVAGMRAYINAETPTTASGPQKEEREE